MNDDTERAIALMSRGIAMDRAGRLGDHVAMHWLETHLVHEALSGPITCWKCGAELADSGDVCAACAENQVPF